MKRRVTTILHAEDAQAVMIGFVIILGILLSASTMYFATQIPELAKKSEAHHTAAVANDFSQLKKLIDGLKGQEFARTATITMVPEKVSLLTSSPPGSNLLFDPGAEELKVIVPCGAGSGESRNWTIPNSSLTFSDYYDQNVSKRVDTSFNMVRLASPTSTDLILDNTQMELSGSLSSPSVHYYNEVILKNNSVLYLKPNTGVLKIFATMITIDASSKIDANGSGYPGGGPGAAGFGTGGGGAPKTGYRGNGGGGAGYGGAGGRGGGTYGGAGGATYGGNQSRDLYMGSGGADGTYNSYNKTGTPGAGGAGGGGVWLDAETITIAGAIFANGANGGAGTGNTGGGGGGSGGGILISGRSVTITGKLSAQGGAGGQGVGGSGDGGGGGGGGRIKVFYDQLVSNEDWSVNSGAGGASVSDTPGNGGGQGTKEKIPGGYIPPSVGQYYKSGYFISTVYDTGNESVWYNDMTWDVMLSGQTLDLKVRTDWDQSMAHAVPWEACPALTSKEGTNRIDLRSVSSVSPVGHRYIQFRADLSTDDETKTPALTRLRVNYSFPLQTLPLATVSGSLTFSSNYLYYPNQRIVYEHGAVIKAQREGGFMLREPPITITNESGNLSLTISLVNLTGAHCSYSGSTTKSVASTFKSYKVIAVGLQYPELLLTITTDYPQIWSTWFTRKFQDAGFDTSFYSINATANTVKVEFKKGVTLYLEKTEVEVEL